MVWGRGRGVGVCIEFVFHLGKETGLIIRIIGYLINILSKNEKCSIT